MCVSDWQADDVIVEAESSLSASEGEEEAEEAGDSENDIRQLKARRHALANKLAQQQKRRDKIQVKLTYTYEPENKYSNREINCNGYFISAALNDNQPVLLSMDFYWK